MKEKPSEWQRCSDPHLRCRNMIGPSFVLFVLLFSFLVSFAFCICFLIFWLVCVFFEQKIHILINIRLCGPVNNTRKLALPISINKTTFFGLKTENSRQKDTNNKQLVDWYVCENASRK